MTTPAGHVVHASTTATVVLPRCDRHPTYWLASCDTCRTRYVAIPQPRRAEQ